MRHLTAWLALPHKRLLVTSHALTWIGVAVLVAAFYFAETNLIRRQAIPAHLSGLVLIGGALLCGGIATNLVYHHLSDRRQKRIIVQRCPSCGYDLRASPERCPECGAAAVSTVSKPKNTPI